MSKRTYFILMFIATTFVLGQSRTREIGLITENDLYTSSKNDKYYTNGIEIFYRFLTKNNDNNVNKKTIEVRVGQYIYNPKFINKGAVGLTNRPFAGYLFAALEKGFYFQNESVVKGGIEFGVIGPNSFAEETQKKIHKYLGYRRVYGWETQVNNALAIQSHFLFSNTILPTVNGDRVDFHLSSEADIGTIFTSVSTGFFTRIGFKKLVPIYDSNFYGSSVSSKSGRVEEEFYFYIAPSIKYQVYDATIQGSLFNDSSPITFDLIPVRFNGEAGFKYRKNNLNLCYVFVYRSKELHNETNTGYFYGSIGVSYLLR